MPNTSKIRQWLGDEWVKMLLLLVLLAILPVSLLIVREWEAAVILFLICIVPYVAWVLHHRYRDTERVKIVTFTIEYLGKEFLKFAVAVGLVLGAIAGVNFAYTTWYPHVISTNVYIDGNWMQGEKRTCVLSTAKQPYELNCMVTITAADSEPHSFDVTYTGADPADVPEGKLRVWTCIRADAAIACRHEKSTGGTQ